MKVKSLMFLIMLGLSLAMVGCSASSEETVPPPKQHTPPPPPPPPPKEEVAIVEVPPPPPPPKPVVKAPPVKAMVEKIPDLNTVYFEFDKTNIEDEFKSQIEKNFEWIRENPQAKIQLQGHADKRGTNQYNLALGERRGMSVLDYLLGLGANPDQFSVISFGEERPEVPNCDDDACYAKNRRVVFTRL